MTKDLQNNIIYYIPGLLAVKLPSECECLINYLDPLNNKLFDFWYKMPHLTNWNTKSYHLYINLIKETYHEIIQSNPNKKIWLV